ncbi:lipocalin family protein [Microbacterium gorillae]|uniref:lipocalin family protein n=1 Tax=Microbacterium gorillae TaxID=1231063 RepID=UPI00058DE098|nr:lipocalin family protein [Microbacterium gorillae]
MSEDLPAVTAVDAIDLARYSGLWYELGRLPMKWEDAKATNITAEYTPADDGTITVDNRCFGDDKKPTQSIGHARPVDGVTGKLRVSFLPEFLRWVPFTEGDYWVLKIEPDYTTALVGSPDRKNLWLLHREPEIDDGLKAEYLAEATRQRFDLANWITPVQTGARVTDDLLKK